MRILSFLGLGVCLPLTAVSSSGAAQPARDIVSASAGKLDDSDNQDENGGRFDDHAIHLEAGLRHRLLVCSEDFDTRMQVLRSDGRTPIAENDDGDAALGD